MVRLQHEILNISNAKRVKTLLVMRSLLRALTFTVAAELTQNCGQKGLVPQALQSDIDNSNTA